MVVDLFRLCELFFDVGQGHAPGLGFGVAQEGLGVGQGRHLEPTRDRIEVRGDRERRARFVSREAGQSRLQRIDDLE